VLSRHIVSLVEESIEGLEDKCFVLRLLGPTHILLQVPAVVPVGRRFPASASCRSGAVSRTTVWRLVEIFGEIQQSSALHHVRTDASFFRSVD